MSYLSKKEQEKIARILANNSVVRFIVHKDKFKFNIGDILIRKNFSFNTNSLVVETVSNSNYLPRRYIYFHEDHLSGIGFIKPISTRTGEPTNTITCMADYNPLFTEFEVDQEYIDSVLLSDGKVNYKAMYHAEAQRVKDIKQTNKKLSFRSNSLKEINDFLLSTFKSGDTIYFARRHDKETYKGLAHRYSERDINSITKINISRMPMAKRVRNTIAIDNADTKSVLKISVSHPWNGSEDMYSIEFIGLIIYRSKPTSIVPSKT